MKIHLNFTHQDWDKMKKPEPVKEPDLTKLKDQLGIPSEVLESLSLSEMAGLQKKSEKKNRE